MMQNNLKTNGMINDNNQDSNTVQYTESAINKSEQDRPMLEKSEYLSADDEYSNCGEISDELFSDDDSEKHIAYYSPDVPNVTDTSVLSSNTSVLQTNCQLTTPKAVIPSTPLSLIPFLNRINEHWTSDLETPQADKTTQKKHMDQSTRSIESAEKCSSLQQCTPNISNRKNVETQSTSTSPVINTKRIRKRPKRRIFKSAATMDPTLALTDYTAVSNVHTCEIDENAPVSRIGEHISLNKCDSTCVSTDTSNGALSNKEETLIDKRLNNESKQLLNDNVNVLSDAVNTSTQLFFLNASFGNIDNICKDSVNEATMRNSDVKTNENGTNKQKIITLRSAESSKDPQNCTERGKWSDQKNVKSGDSTVEERICTAKNCETFLSDSNFGKHVNEEFRGFDTREKSLSLSRYNKFTSRNEKKALTLGAGTLKKQAVFTTAAVNVSTGKLNELNYGLDQIKETGCVEKKDATLIHDKKYTKRDNDKNLPLRTTLSSYPLKAYEMFPFDEEPMVGQLKSTNKDIGQSYTKMHSTNIKVIAPSIEQFPTTKSNIPMCGFKTAGGRSLRISEEAMSKAKLAFVDEVESIGKDFGRTSMETCSNYRNLDKTSAEKEITEDEISDDTAHKQASVEQSDKVPFCGFKTAGGQLLNVSNEAMSKAKLLLADRFENDVTDSKRVIINANRTNEKRNILPHLSSVSSVNDNASKKGPPVLNEFIEDEFSDGNELVQMFDQASVNNTHNKNSRQAHVSGFTTARGSSINVNKKSLARAKSLFTEEDDTDLKDLEVTSTEEKSLQMKNVPSGFSFTTANGNAVNVSEKALQKAEALFANDLSDMLDTAAVPESSRHEIEYRKKENVVDTMEKYAPKEPKTDGARKMSSGRNDGAHSSVTIKKNVSAVLCRNSYPPIGSKKDLSKVQRRSTGLCNAFPMAKISSDMDLGPKENSRQEDYEVTELNQDPAQARRSCTSKCDNVQEIQSCQEYVNKSKSSDKNTKAFTGFSSASGCRLIVSNDALLKAQSLFSEKSPDAPENVEPIVRPSQKRVFSDLDGDSPTERQGASNFKKARPNNEYAGRKLFHDKTNTTLGTENRSSVSIDTQRRNTVANLQNIKQRESGVSTLENSKCHRSDHGIKSSQLFDNLTNATVLTDIVKDESDPNEDTQSASQIKKHKRENTPDPPSSPVIGRSYTTRKRKKKRSIVSGTNNSLANSCDTKENILIQNYGVALKSPIRTLNMQMIPHKSCDNVTQLSGTVVAQQRSITSDTTNSTDYGDTQLIMAFIDKSTSILQKRMEAALEQDKVISAKSRNRPQPTSSKLFLCKLARKATRISWRQLTNTAVPTPRNDQELIDNNISLGVLEITAATAGAYRFRCADFYGDDVIENNTDGLQMEDGARLIPDENGYAGISEFKRSFLASPGVDPRLLPSGWIENHYGWIVWKLASVDRMKFGTVNIPRALTPARVLAQLKYRYDREIDRSERPALRRILEKDDAASKRMVLCVSSVIQCNYADISGKSTSVLGTSPWKMVLSDGWYSVPAQIDTAMVNYITSGKVKEGTKLVTYGAELLNCDQGHPPLEIPGDVSLKIHTNSTRRARWDTKLGYMSRPGPIPVKLGSICPNGGLIGKIKVLIARVYPMLYHEKTSTGESVFRNSRCEEKAYAVYEQECRSRAEAFYAKAEKQFVATRKSYSTDTDSIDLLAAEWNEECDKLSQKEFLSKQQQEILLDQCRMKEEQFREKLQSKLSETLPPPRKVSPVLKIRIIQEDKSAILSVWSPSDDLISILKEGNSTLICNVLASGKRGGELHLSAGRNSIFNKEVVSDKSYSCRIYTPLRDIGDPSFDPAYSEFDTVGFVVSVTPAPYAMNNFVAVNLAYPDTSNSEFSYLSILFWRGVDTSGYQDILTIGSFVACTNLEWRRATSWTIPIAYYTERTAFTRNPRQSHLLQPFDALKSSVLDPNTTAVKCGEDVSIRMQKKAVTKTPHNNTPDKDAPSQSIHRPPTSNKFSPLQLGSNKSPHYTVRSSSIQERLEKLKHYAEPPELSPIVIRSSSKRASLDFRSPLRASRSKLSDHDVHIKKNV